MKTPYSIIFVLALFVLPSCFINSRPEYPDPEACFNPSVMQTYVGEQVKFINCSEHAKEYEWDFGDGTITSIATPVHTFMKDGIYTVTLTAIGEDGIHSFVARDIDVRRNAPSDLDIMVKFAGTDAPVPGCKVTLYANEQDWIDLKNPVSETVTTAANGQVFFYDISPGVYYVDAIKPVDDHRFYSNEKLGNTVEVLLGQMNQYDVEVELLNNKKSTKAARPAKRRKK